MQNFASKKNTRMGFRLDSMGSGDVFRSEIRFFCLLLWRYLAAVAGSSRFHYSDNAQVQIENGGATRDGRYGAGLTGEV